MLKFATLLAVAGATALAFANTESRVRPAVSGTTLTLDLQVNDHLGAPFSGLLEFTVEQAAMSADLLAETGSLHPTTKRWNPNVVDCVSGAVLHTVDLDGYAGTKIATLIVEPVSGSSTGPIPIGMKVSDDPVSIRRAALKFTPTAVGSDFELAPINPLALSLPPQIGTLSVSAPSASIIDVDVAPVFGAPPARASRHRYSELSLATAVAHPLYSWSTAFAFHVTNDESVRPYGAAGSFFLRRNTSGVFALEERGRILLTSSSSLADVEFAVAWPVASYSALSSNDPLDPASSLTERLAVERHVDSAPFHLYLDENAASQALYLIGDMPPGNYTVEVWRKSDIASLTPSVSQSSFAVVSGVDTPLSVP